MHNRFLSASIALVLLASAAPAAALPTPVSGARTYAEPLGCFLVPEPRVGKVPAAPERSRAYFVYVTNGLGHTVNAGVPVGYSVLFPDGSFQNATPYLPSVLPAGTRIILDRPQLTAIPTGCTAGLPQAAAVTGPSNGGGPQPVHSGKPVVHAI